MGYNPLICSAYKKFRSDCASFHEFKEYIRCVIPNMNHDNDELLSSMYERYKVFFDTLDKSSKKIGRLPGMIGSWFGFEKRPTTLQFFLDRGWDLATSKSKLKERQRVGAVDAIAKRRNVSLEEAKEISAASAAKAMLTTRARDDYEDICFRKGNANRFEFYMTVINPETNCLYTESEARELISEKQSRGFLSYWSDVKAGKKTYAGTNTLEFYRRRGMNDREAKVALKRRQNTRSLDKMSDKYGEVEGKRRFDLANERWFATLDAKTDEEKREILIKKVQQGNKFFSKWSQDMIGELLTLLKDAHVNVGTVHYGEKEYFIYDTDVKKVFFYDLVFRDLNICVEFNGSHVHPNRAAMDDKQWEKWIQPFTKEKADVCFEKDRIKNECARKNGFDVFIVWDSDDKESKFLEILNKFKEKK